MRGPYTFFVLLVSSFALTQDSPFFARLERVCLSVSIVTDQPKDEEVEKEVLALAEDSLRAAAFPLIENEADPRCSELGTGMMLFSAYGPNSYPGSVAGFETRLEVSMPTPYEDIPRVTVYAKWADAFSQEGDDATLYKTFKDQVPMWTHWFLEDLQKARLNAESTPEK